MVNDTPKLTDQEVLQRGVYFSLGAEKPSTEVGAGGPSATPSVCTDECDGERRRRPAPGR